MKRTVLAVLVAGFISAPVFALAAEGDQQTSRAERMQQWAADRETMLDAKLAGMKAGLGLTADQEKLWSPFESAVRDADRSRVGAMRQMMQMREQGERTSPIDHLEAMADRLSQSATNIKKIADAAKPLYDSLNESQKHNFGMLGRMLIAGAVPVRHGDDAPSHGRTRSRQRRVVPGPSASEKEDAAAPLGRVFRFLAPRAADSDLTRQNGAISLAR
jgi:hypothetical protein